MTVSCPDGVVIRLVGPTFIYYITSNDYILFIKITHMKTEVMTHSPLRVAQQAHKEGSEATPFAGKTVVTIFYAIAFLALVMCLSYLFITGTR